MLILSRKLGEEVVIGDNIRLTVVSIRGSQIQLGLTAPAHVVIRRAELCLNTGDRGAPPSGPTTLEGEP
jgi:carbon storage regulator